MNIFSTIIDSIIGFVKNNPLTVIIIVMLIACAPALAGGILIGLLILLGVIFLIPIIMLFRLQRISRRMEKEAHQTYSNTYQKQQNKREGEVKIYTTSTRPQKRVNEDVGDYVEFEEVKNDNKK